MRVLTSLGIGCLLLASAGSQGWQVLSTRGFGGHRMVCDPHRDRIVMFAHSVNGPRLLEWDGTAWLQTWLATGPNAPSSRVPRLAYDDARRETVLLLDQRTWSYDGASWRLAANSAPGSGPSDNPSPETIAFDARRRVVVFYDKTFQRTHEWNGVGWRGVHAQMGALSSMDAFVGYDPVRQQVVGFTPFPGGAFAWDGLAWSQIPEGPRPPGFLLREPAVCTDPVRNRLFAFGGIDATLGPRNELWQWDGFAWTQVGTGPRLHPVTMAGHVGSAQLVLFGYSRDEQDFDTWSWDGTFHRRDAGPCLSLLVADPIRRRIVGTSCPGRLLASPRHTYEWDGGSWQYKAGPHPVMTGLVFDGTRGVVVGIESNLQQPNVRTWFWTQQGWQQQFPPVDPPWQMRQALCHDPLRGLVVMFGFNGTWEWDGSVWHRRLTAVAPRVATSLAPVSAVYDPTASLVRLVVATTAGNQEWTWNGTDWQQVAAPGLPTGGEFELAFDERTRRVLLLGAAGTWARTSTGWQLVGIAPTSLQAVIDPFTGVLRTWQQGTWQGFTGAPADAAAYGSGCASQGALSLLAFGRPTPVGDRLRFDVGRAAANAPAALYASVAPASTPLGGGCTLLLRTAVHCGDATTSSAGGASFVVPIPDRPELLGLEVFWQAVALEPGGPLAGVAALTNGLRVRVGD